MREDVIYHAVQIAERYLAKMTRTREEVRRHLADQGIDETTTEDVLLALSRRHVVDDAAYSRRYGEIALAKGRGKARIIAELLAKGVERQTAESALDGLVTAETERMQALHMAEGMPGNAAKVAGKLQRQGYEEDTIAWVLEQLGLNEGIGHWD